MTATATAERTAEATRYYPVKVTSTVVHYIWVQGENQADAVKSAGYDTHDLIHNEDVADGWMDVEAPDQYDIMPNERDLGPNAACAQCGVVEREPGHLKWSDHKGDCPDHWHHAGVRPIKANEGYEWAGYIAECSCGQAGLARIAGYPRARELPATTILHPTKDEAAAVLREHVEGRHHSKNIPLGIHGTEETS